MANLSQERRNKMLQFLNGISICLNREKNGFKYFHMHKKIEKKSSEKMLCKTSPEMSNSYLLNSLAITHGGGY